MQKFIEGLKERVDVVIFDAPPLMAVTDAQILSTLVDGVVCVVRRGTPRQALVRSAESLAQVKANLLGFVMNRMIQGDAEDYYYYYNYYYDEPRETVTQTVETSTHPFVDNRINDVLRSNGKGYDPHVSEDVETSTVPHYNKNTPHPGKS